MALVQIADVVVPEIFTPYVQLTTEQKSRLIQSGAAARNGQFDLSLQGGGLTFNDPSWNDLADDTDNIGDDSETPAVPNKLTSNQEIQVRLSRNQHWKTADLSAALAGSDPATAIANKVGGYWARRAQAVFVATMTGVFADNTANDAGDYTNDITGVFAAGVTDFSAEALIDSVATAGDSLEDFAMMMVHSVVYAKMRKNNLIDFIRDSDNDTRIARFGDLEVIIDDGMPVATQDYDTWIFGPGAIQVGVGTPKVPTEVTREALQGLGAGTEVLSSRIQWILHPGGHAYVGTAPNGGPDNTAGANQLAAAASWNRVFPERKQIKIARLRTTEA
jgi:hypothetical protein